MIIAGAIATQDEKTAKEWVLALRFQRDKHMKNFDNSALCQILLKLL